MHNQIASCAGNIQYTTCPLGLDTNECLMYRQCQAPYEHTM